MIVVAFVPEREPSAVAAWPTAAARAASRADDYNCIVFLLLSALGLGFLHGLGGDHLMAIAALSVDGGATP